MKDIVIYSTPACGYCIAARRLLERKGFAFEEKNVLGDRTLFAEMVGKAGGRMSFPQIFIGDRHVGGFDDLAELDRRGQLEALVAG